MRHRSQHVLIVDIETVPHDCASDYVPAPDLESIQPARNLKDPEKIAADIERRRADALAEHAESLSRCALDWNLNRIVAIGISDEYGYTEIELCRDETDEWNRLQWFWREAKGKQLIGFCARTFDVPTLVQRSRLLGVEHAVPNLARYGRGDVIDLRDLLTFDDARYEAIMPRSLASFCRRFGIEVSDAISGSQIPDLVKAGDWAAVEAHVKSDVELTAALARRLGVIWTPSEPSLPLEPEPIV